MDNPQIAPRYIPNQTGELPGAQTVSAVPVGSIVPYGRTLIPEGYLACDGTTYNQADFSDLFQTIGLTYSVSGDPVDMFRVPDMRARFAVGADGSGAGIPYFQPFNEIGDLSGATRITLQANQLPQHQHGFRFGTAYNVVGQPFTIPARVGTSTVVQNSQAAVYNTTDPTPITQVPLIIKQPYLTLQYLIKY
jgi:microcystin-dependent protein